MRPLIALNIGDAERMELLRGYIDQRQEGDPYNGLIKNWWEAFLGLDIARQ